MNTMDDKYEELGIRDAVTDKMIETVRSYKISKRVQRMLVNGRPAHVRVITCDLGDGIIVNSNLMRASMWLRGAYTTDFSDVHHYRFDQELVRKSKSFPSTEKIFDVNGRVSAFSELWTMKNLPFYSRSVDSVNKMVDLARLHTAIEEKLKELIEENGGIAYKYVEEEPSDSTEKQVRTMTEFMSKYKLSAADVKELLAEALRKEK